MNIAFALISGKGVHFTPNHKIQMYLTNNDTLIEGSFGEDTFRYNGFLFSEMPISATGRKAIHEPQLDITAYAGVWGVPAALHDGEIRDMVLWVDSNFILDQGELQTYYRLQATVDSREIPQPLYTPMTPVTWMEKGVFCIKGLGSLMLH